MWAEASSLASASHAAVARDWLAQTALHGQELAELVENLDAADRAARTTAQAHANERAALEEALRAARAAESHATAELQSTLQAQAELEKQLVDERAATRTLRETLAALIERIPAVEPGK